jgi:RNA polymerase sigma factor (sigma-70 family)
MIASGPMADDDLVMRARTDPGAMEALVRGSVDFIWWAVHRFATGYERYGFEADDMFQAAALGLVGAIRRWDPARGSLTSVAAVACRNAIWSMLRDSARRRADWTAISLDVPITGDDDDRRELTLMSVLSTDDFAPTTVSSLSVRDFLRGLGGRERVIAGCLASGLTQREAARRVGLSQGYVSKIVAAMRRSAERAEAC